MIVRHDELTPIDFDGLKIFDYTADAELDASMAWIEVPPGSAHAEAFSRRSAKYYLVVSGEIEFTLAGREISLRAKDFCLVHRGERFAYRNDGPAPATLVLAHAPSFELDSEVFVS